MGLTAKEKERMTLRIREKLGSLMETLTAMYAPCHTQHVKHKTDIKAAEVLGIADGFAEMERIELAIKKLKDEQKRAHVSLAAQLSLLPESKLQRKTQWEIQAIIDAPMKSTAEVEKRAIE